VAPYLLLKRHNLGQLRIPLPKIDEEARSLLLQPRQMCFLESSDVKRLNSLYSIQNSDSGHTSDAFRSPMPFPTASQVPRTRHPTYSKDGFQFIHIHEPSGKADMAAGSHLRSHLMRKYHENRRQQKKLKVRALVGLKKTGCEHTGVLYGPVQYPFQMDTFSEARIYTPQVVYSSLPRRYHHTWKTHSCQRT
jgi:hypothetical protein